MTTPQTDHRGQYTGNDGKVYHLNPIGIGAKYPPHEGEWLKCDECNPVVQVAVTPVLVALREEWAAAKEAKKAADEREKKATAAFKTALFEASNNAPRSLLAMEGEKPVGLTLSEPWRLNTKRLQAEQPALYVEYAEQGQTWTLSERGR